MSIKHEVQLKECENGCVVVCVCVCARARARGVCVEM